MKAPYGWTVVARGGDPARVHVYKRDCPAPADLAPFTHASKAKALAAGKRGEYAYKRARYCACTACNCKSTELHGSNSSYCTLCLSGSC